MPRLRTTQTPLTAVGAIPAELMDREARVWQSVALTKKWLKSHGLPVGDRVKFGPFNRWKCAADAWALEAGIVLHSGPHELERLDLPRMRELGLPGGGSGGAMLERLEYARTQID
ncbi:hypothetical protein FB472_1961 [Rhodoglobus vestalii]|uniref:Uncharacterized protein n=1 Tax=Rhodoglobus vestalii TaxID=193384 RepID=A0A8H2K6Y0_9MICO|nr:hypothetical protein [Rhodoglobus vestalii]TQO20330.1 hypothetical protein FB472_1961 [Rhodoglobus vestalii]